CGGVSPVECVVGPREIVATVMVPLMTMLFDFVGMVGAYLVAVYLEGVDRGIFLENTRWLIDHDDVLQGVFKSLVFGCSLALISCYQGFFASGGAKGVGIATTRAVWASSVSILGLDSFLSAVWLEVFPPGGR